MKKILTFVLVVLAFMALASTVSAATCTVDQRPAATLLVPYFQVHFNADGSVDSSSSGSDTLVTVVNASSQATLAHVVVWNRRSVHLLDFNIALTGFDEVAFSMAQVLTGHLPSTPEDGTVDSGQSGSDFAGEDVCQRNPSAKVFPNFDGFLRFRPTSTPTTQDNAQATTQYSDPAFGSDFAALLADALDYDDSEDCPLPTDSGDGDITGSSVAGNGNISGYVTIDMVNYCNLSDPSDANYWNDDAAGWENNLWGDYIIVNNSGIPTLGAPTVAVEAALETVGVFSDGDTFPQINNEPFNRSLFQDEDNVRTFYARYWEDSDTGNYGDSGSTSNGSGSTSENHYLAITFPFAIDDTFGDEREPLGLRYGARYLNDGGLSSAFRVWRASLDPTGDDDDLPDLTGNSCTTTEKNVFATIYDTDENTIVINGCPSPCPQTHINFPYETQRVDAGSVINLTQSGWIYINFLGNEDDSNVDPDSDFDQAWIDYEMSAGAAFINASVPGVQLDTSNCNVVGLTDTSSFDHFPEYAWPAGLGR